MSANDRPPVGLLSLPFELQADIISRVMPSAVTLTLFHELAADTHDALATPLNVLESRNEVTMIEAGQGTAHVQSLHTVRYQLFWESLWIPELMLVSKRLTPIVRSSIAKAIEIRISEKSIRGSAQSGERSVSIFDRRIGQKVPWAETLPRFKVGGLPDWILRQAGTLIIDALEPERSVCSSSFFDIGAFARLQEVTVAYEALLPVLDILTFGISHFDLLKVFHLLQNNGGATISVADWKAPGGAKKSRLIQQAILNVLRREDEGLARLCDCVFSSTFYDGAIDVSVL